MKEVQAVTGQQNKVEHDNLGMQRNLLILRRPIVDFGLHIGKARILKCIGFHITYRPLGTLLC